jgi:hypothetical protein
MVGKFWLKLGKLPGHLVIDFSAVQDELAAAAHSWAKLQKPTINEIEKIREIDESYLCLQRFDKF